MKVLLSIIAVIVAVFVMSAQLSIGSSPMNILATENLIRSTDVTDAEKLDLLKQLKTLYSEIGRNDIAIDLGSILYHLKSLESSDECHGWIYDDYMKKRNSQLSGDLKLWPLFDRGFRKQFDLCRGIWLNWAKENDKNLPNEAQSDSKLLVNGFMKIIPLLDGTKEPRNFINGFNEEFLHEGLREFWKSKIGDEELNKKSARQLKKLNRQLISRLCPSEFTFEGVGFFIRKMNDLALQLEQEIFDARLKEKICDEMQKVFISQSKSHLSELFNKYYGRL